MSNLPSNWSNPNLYEFSGAYSKKIFWKNTSHSVYICRAFHLYEFSGGYVNEISGKSYFHNEYICRAFHLYEFSDGYV